MNKELYHRLKKIVSAFSIGLFEREETIALTLLSALANTSIFYYGPPGVAKSMIARRIALIFKDAVFFDYLMGRFSTPDELFGPVSIARLRQDDSYSRNIEGFLPQANIVFLDEIWKASSPIQNSLLTILNERIFRNGSEVVSVPLKCFIAASNEITVDSDTAAFWDRFLIRINIEPIQEESVARSFLAETSYSPSQDRTDRNGNINKSPQIEHTNNQIFADLSDLLIENAEWENWIKRSQQLPLSETVLSLLLEIRKEMAERSQRDKNYYISDRRWKQIVEVMKVAAFFEGQEEVGILETFLIPHCIWNSLEMQGEVKEIFQTVFRKNAFSYFWNISESIDQNEIAQFEQDLHRYSSKTYEKTVLEPIPYSNEYLRLMFTEGNTSALTKPEHKGKKTEKLCNYLIWAEDLQALDTRRELECFVQESGNFVQTKMISAKWHNAENWELETSLGKAKIEVQERLKTFTEPVPIPPKEAKQLTQLCNQAIQKLEKTIFNLNIEINETINRSKELIFFPQNEDLLFLESAEPKQKKLEDQLAQLLTWESSILKLR